jgi:DNA-binding NarL/FixJ family response regulator
MTHSNTQAQYTVIIADDHEIIRDAVVDLLRRVEEATDTHYEVVATVENGLEAIAMVKSHRPDLLFLDISMPLASGVEIVRDIRAWSPDTRILVFTGVTSSGLLSSTVEAGVDALFSKSTQVSELAEKLPLIMSGGRYVDPSLVELIEQGQQNTTLTEREHQVLNMLVTGKTNKEVARILNISPKTVDKHRTSLMQKLGVHSIAELMARALKDGLIDPG